MAKELIRVPRILGGNCNSGLIERLYEAGGNVMLLDLIIYLSSHHLTDLFGTSWFSVEDFCHKRGITIEIQTFCREYKYSLPLFSQ